MRMLPETQFQWWQLKKWAKRNGLLESKLADKCDKVRTFGNFAAHYAEQVGRNRASGITDAKPQLPASNTMSGGDGGTTSRTRKLVASYQMWIPAEDAYWSLNVTKLVILTVAEKWGHASEPS